MCYVFKNDIVGMMGFGSLGMRSGPLLILGSVGNRAKFKRLPIFVSNRKSKRHFANDFQSRCTSTTYSPDKYVTDSASAFSGLLINLSPPPYVDSVPRTWLIRDLSELAIPNDVHAHLGDLDAVGLWHCRCSKLGFAGWPQPMVSQTNGCAILCFCLSQTFPDYNYISDRYPLIFCPIAEYARAYNNNSTGSPRLIRTAFTGKHVWNAMY